MTSKTATAAQILSRVRKLEDDLRTATSSRGALHAQRKEVLLDGNDAALAKFDLEHRSRKEALETVIRDAEYLLPILRDELRTAEQAEKKSQLESRRKAGYEVARRRISEFDERLRGSVSDAMKLLVSVVREEQELYALVANINRDLPEGAEPLPGPGRAVRYSPPVSAVVAGAKRLASRLKKEVLNKPNLTGDDRYESYEKSLTSSDLVKGFSDGERAFDPPPLFRSMEIPALRKGDPSYRIPFNLK